jgi:hypothetical protein
MSNAPDSKKLNTKIIDGKQRYFEPAPTEISVESFRQVVMTRRSVRKFTDKPKQYYDSSCFYDSRHE